MWKQPYKHANIYCKWKCSNAWKSAKPVSPDTAEEIKRLAQPVGAVVFSYDHVVTATGCDKDDGCHICECRQIQCIITKQTETPEVIQTFKQVDYIRLYQSLKKLKTYHWNTGSIFFARLFDHPHQTYWQTEAGKWVLKVYIQKLLSICFKSTTLCG